MGSRWLPIGTHKPDAKPEQRRCGGTFEERLVFDHEDRSKKYQCIHNIWTTRTNIGFDRNHPTGNNTDRKSENRVHKEDSTFGEK